jgi:predicted pyridoxine 5'-phosphate oxidase superfamily flavin-nucleotide-binding protein
MSTNDVNGTVVWHAGELALQASVGMAERMAEVGPRVIRDHMPDQHRAFFEQLSWLVVGALDDSGMPWASVLEGSPGFVHSPDPRVLRVGAVPAVQDPLSRCLHDGTALGLLGIELHTRRRNRMNGTTMLREGGLDVGVMESFGNCPQYIQKRVTADASTHGEDGERVRTPPVSSRAATLSADDRSVIAHADTFFVASGVLPRHGADAARVDVSHRGGRPGFVKVEGNCLTVPDFSGNRHFNTLGNLLLNPQAGLLFVDFESGDLLHVGGDVELVPDGSELASFAGAERLWRVHVRTVVRRPAAIAGRWQFVEASPRLAATGAWQR